MTWPDAARRAAAEACRRRVAKLFHREGVGSFRLHTLMGVRGASHLRELVGVKRRA